MNATTPLPNLQHPPFYPPHLEKFQRLENNVDPLAVSIAPWLALVLLADRLPAEQLTRAAAAIAAQEERSASMGHRSPVEAGTSPHHHLALARAVAAARESLVQAGFAAADADGRSLSFGELVGEVLGVRRGERAPAPVPGVDQTRQPDGLISPREREVLELVVAGRTNKEIAEALFISPFTVKAHVASLLTKLDADNRAQLAGIAMRRRLVAA